MADLIDSYSESNYSTLEGVYGGSVEGLAQSFTGVAKKITSCKFYLTKSNNPSGNIYAKLYAHTGTFGISSKPTGPALATSDALDISGVSSATINLHEFTFSGANQYLMSAATKYCIIIEFTGGNSNNRLYVGADSSSPTAGGNAAYLFSSTWYETGSEDMCFYVYGEAAAVGPTVLTSACDQILIYSVRGNGNITNTGGENCTRRGFCYKAGTSGDPTTSDSTAYDDSSYGTGAYTKVITGLKPNTTYRVRAYAVNTAGTGYGTTVSVTTDQSGRFFILFQ